MSEVRVAVIGGSLVGTTAAVFLQAKGIEAHVYEATPAAVTRAGGVIGLEHPALQALEDVGIPQDEIVAVPSELVLSVTLSGGVELERETCLYPGRTTTWTRLHGALAARLAPGTYHAGHRLRTVGKDQAAARLHFADDTSAVADIVIGADGRTSTVRQLVDSRRRLHYAGYVAHRGQRPGCPADWAQGFIRKLAPATMFNTFPLDIGIDGDVELDWTLYLNETPGLYEEHFGQRPDRLTIAFPRAITSDVRDFVDSAARRLLPERERDIVLSTRDRMAVPVLDISAPNRLVWPWGASRVVLAGDAAGPLHPSTARGANAGLEQVKDLATVLHQHAHRGADRDAALDAYQRRQLPPIRCALREGPILGHRMGLGVFGHAVQDLVP